MEYFIWDVEVQAFIQYNLNIHSVIDKCNLPLDYIGRSALAIIFPKGSCPQTLTIQRLQPCWSVLEISRQLVSNLTAVQDIIAMGVFLIQGR